MARLDVRDSGERKMSLEAIYGFVAGLGPDAVTHMVELGVSARGAAILLQLFRARKLSCGPLAERVGLDRASLSRQLQTLEDAGLVTRGRRPDDQRKVAVRLTPRGREISRHCAELDERARPASETPATEPSQFPPAASGTLATPA